MTQQEYKSITDSTDMIKITYETKYSKGEIHVKRSYYLKVMKKFTKALKDAVITNMEEYRESV